MAEHQPVNDHVDIFDAHGERIGSKPYADVDRVKDILHCVQTLFLLPGGRIALTLLPTKSAWGGRLGTTVGTIVRSGEATEVAVIRGLRKELGIERPHVEYLGKTFEVMEGGVTRWLSAYCCVYDGALTMRPEDGELRIMTREELTAAIAANRASFSPSFLTLWETYQAQLPL